MAEELGKIEKPAAADFKAGRKLYFIPLVHRAEESPEDYLEKYNKYWEQVEKQIAELESKLGRVSRVYHELVSVPGDEGCKVIKELSEKSHEIVQICTGKGAQLEAVEDGEILTEFMDWNRCLLIGLQNAKVITRVYKSYQEAGKKRNESIAERIDSTLQKDETGILLMSESHHVQFPSDIQVFYVAPPALDEIKRWLREQETKSGEKD